MQGRPLRVRCPKCEVGAAKHGAGHNLVRTGGSIARRRTLNSEQLVCMYIVVRCLDCGYTFESRHPRALALPLMPRSRAGESLWYHVNGEHDALFCRLCGKRLSYWAGSETQHGEMHVRRGEAYTKLDESVVAYFVKEAK